VTVGSKVCNNVITKDLTPPKKVSLHYVMKYPGTF